MRREQDIEFEGKNKRKDGTDDEENKSNVTN